VGHVQRVLAPAALLLLFTAAGTASALTSPGRTRSLPAPVAELALTHASIAFSVGATRRDCDHVELWNPDSKGTWRFGRPRPCGDVASTGSGIADVAVASSRVLWLEYTGGNIREWSLKTATITRKTPRLLRFVARDVDERSPIVLGAGARDALPYAVDRDVTFLGDDGRAIFRWRAPARVVALAAGPVPTVGAARVAALLDTGDVVLLSARGDVVARYFYGRLVVKALHLAGVGLVVQRDEEVELRGADSPPRRLPLPPEARMLDYAQGRVVYARGRDVYTLRVRTGKHALLLRGVRPTLVGLDAHGLAWATGRSVHWKCAVCIRFGN
jgi:hypothetical protein